ncbi:hypothetical protein [Nonomuraea cavernae]|uniref:hypothetical protein n=1 Tax=Nonomuraea cavernae TaxID=2045107 RepID=UPI0033DC3ABF
MAAGAAGVVAVGESAALGSAGPGALVGQVTRVDGALVEVALDAGGTVLVPPVGFPPGWQLRPGDPVMVMKAEFHGVPDHAAPVVVSVSGSLGTQRGRSVSVAGANMNITPQTIQMGEKSADGSHTDAFCIRNRTDNSLTAVALRFHG